MVIINESQAFTFFYSLYTKYGLKVLQEECFLFLVKLYVCIHICPYVKTFSTSVNYEILLNA